MKLLRDGIALWQKYKANKNFVLAGIDFKEDKKLIKKFTAKKVFVCAMLNFSVAMAILGEN